VDEFKAWLASSAAADNQYYSMIYKEDEINITKVWKIETIDIEDLDEEKDNLV